MRERVGEGRWRGERREGGGVGSAGDEGMEEDRGKKRIGEGCRNSRHNGDLWHHNRNPSAAPEQLGAMGQWWNIALGDGPNRFDLV